MRITTLIIVATMMQVSAASFAQKISLSEENAPLAKIFKEITHQTGYGFFVSESLLRGTRPVTIDVKNIELDDVLKMVFNNQSLDYKIDDKAVIVSRKERSLFDNLKSKAARMLSASADISGRVIDSLGQPLIGASVSLENASYHTLTDDRGNFRFRSVAPGEYTIIVTYIGYARLEKNIKVEGVNLDVVLTPKLVSSALDQIQVIGYGAESKRFSVGSVSTVNADIIEKQPVSNPLLALQGQAAGLAVTGTNGVPGSTALVQIRGQNTLGTTLQVKPYDQPLFIIDGVPFAPQNVNISQLNSIVTAQSYTGGISQATGISPFNSINPNDIESISILKDAAATSIYGSQGANGVVLITTKRGKAGKTTFDLNLNSQLNFVARPIEFLNTQQYLQLRREAFAADEVTPSDDPGDYMGFAPDLTIFDQNKYTDWANVIAGKTTTNTDLHATVSGGNATNTFLVSGGYTRSNYNYPGNFSDQRFTLHSAVHNTSTDKRFTLDLVTDFGYDQNHSAGYGGGRGVTLAPNLPDLIDASGNLIWNYEGYPLNVQNFYSTLMQPTYLQNFNFNSSLNVNYKILEGLTIGANVGYNRINTTERSENPASSQEPTYAQASAAFGDNTAQAINVEPQINYSKAIGKGILSALLGGTYKKVTSNISQVQAYGYSNDNFLGTVIGATTTYPSEDINLLKYIAGFARLKYIYDQKYIIEVSGRRDGSSNFGPGNQFGNFASVGAGWIFSDERIFDAFPVFSYGKLSGSYGTTGGDASRAYSYQALYQNISSVPAFQNIKQAYAYNLYNPNFRWATKKSLDLSLDLGFFDNRLSLNATYYRNREGDQLVDYPLPVQSGFTRVFGNLNAEVQNKGWEFTATSTNIKRKNFSWTTNFNLTFNRNKLLDFPDLASSSYADKYVVGEPTSIIIGYKYKGVNPETGLYEFYDKDGNTTYSPRSGTVENGGDQMPVGNREVRFMGGFGNTFNYKNFNLYVFCQFSSGNAPNYLSGLYSVDFPGGLANQPAAILGEYWQKPGDDATIQRLASTYYSNSMSSLAAFTQSDGIYSDATYLRVKTVSLSYALPDAFIQRVHVKGANIYVNAQNLFTITNYKAGDPEQPGTFTSFPLQRIVAFGLNFKF